MNYSDDALRYSKGSIYWADMPWNDGSATRGRRPVVIISGIRGSLISPVVTVCPLTSTIKDYPCNVILKHRIDPDKESCVLCNQITTIAKKSLLGYIGQLPEEDLREVNKTVLDVLGFPVSLIEEVESKLDSVEQLRKDKEALETLVPQALALLNQFTDILSRVAPDSVPSLAKTATAIEEQTKTTTKKKPTVVKRSPATIKAFVKEWATATNKAEVAQKYNFSGLPSARQFYNRYKDKYGA